jgi:hypothetical protein
MSRLTDGNAKAFHNRVREILEETGGDGYAFKGTDMEALLAIEGPHGKAINRALREFFGAEEYPELVETDPDPVPPPPTPDEIVAALSAKLEELEEAFVALREETKTSVGQLTKLSEGLAIVVADLQAPEILVTPPPDVIETPNEVI